MIPFYVLLFTFLTSFQIYSFNYANEVLEPKDHQVYEEYSKGDLGFIDLNESETIFKPLTYSVIFNNFSNSDELKARMALNKLVEVLNSEEFKLRILNHKFNGKRKFASTSMSNEEVYQTIMKAKELVLNLPANSSLDLDLNLYYSWRNVVGYTYPNNVKIFMNTKYFKPFTIGDVAGNIVHEWTHKLGFDHDFNSTKQRPYSVPYAIGSLIVNMVNQ